MKAFLLTLWILVITNTLALRVLQSKQEGEADLIDIEDQIAKLSPADSEPAKTKLTSEPNGPSSRQGNQSIKLGNQAHTIGFLILPSDLEARLKGKKTAKPTNSKAGDAKGDEPSKPVGLIGFLGFLGDLSDLTERIEVIKDIQGNKTINKAVKTINKTIKKVANKVANKAASKAAGEVAKGTNKEANKAISLEPPVNDNFNGQIAP